MPLTEKGQKILSSMTKEYGEKKGKQVFYASANAGKITGVHEGEDSLEDAMEDLPAYQSSDSYNPISKKGTKDSNRPTIVIRFK